MSDASRAEATGVGVEKKKASEALAETLSGSQSGAPDVREVATPSIGESGQRLDRLLDISVTVQVVLGSTRMAIGDLVKLGRGSIIPLDRRVGEPVEILVNDRTMAHGEIVMVGEGGDRIGIALTKVLGWQDGSSIRTA